jgi:hypothetical protein
MEVCCLAQAPRGSESEPMDQADIRQTVSAGSNNGQNRNRNCCSDYGSGNQGCSSAGNEFTHVYLLFVDWVLCVGPYIDQMLSLSRRGV